MKKSNVFLIALLTISIIFMLSGISFAEDLADSKDGLITRIHQGYVQAAGTYAAIFVGYTLNLFWSLVLLDLLYHMIMFHKTGNGELDEFYKMIFFRVIYAGFFFLIVSKGGEVADFIYQVVVNDFARQMINAGVGAVGWAAGVDAVSPADFLDIGFSICFAITEKAGFWSGTGLMVNIIALILIILFMLIIAEIVVAMIEYYFVASIGYFLLAFGGLTATQSIVWNYWKTLFAQSFKIMAIYAVTTISFGFIQAVAGTDAQIEAIVSDTESLLVLVASVFLFSILVHKVPERLTGVITGAMFNGSVNAGASSMIKNMISAGAGVVAGAALTSVAGANVVNSAVKLAETQQAASGADNKTSGTGGNTGSSGSPQNLSGGSGMVGQVVKNLAGSVGATIMAKGAKGENTFANSLGTMANNLDSQTKKSNATDAVKNPNQQPDNKYSIPTEKDIKNTVTGRD